MLYLGAGAVLVRSLALEVGLTSRVATLAGVLFLFHPHLNAVIDRPMPDLSEGFWVALSFFAWLRLMQTNHPMARLALAALIGLCLAIGQANRITGVFAIPVLVVCTLAFHPRKFLWLTLAGFFAAIFVGIEASVYHSVTGDWLHSLHANLGARGRKGTESIHLWELPFRFVPALFQNPSDTIYSLLALAGVVPVLRRLGMPGAALVTYALLYLLSYSCALQDISPPRPLVRDGDRFLASLAFPFTVLSAAGLGYLAEVLARILPLRLRTPTVPQPVLAAVLAFALFFVNSRPVRPSNFLSEIATHLRTVTAGASVLSHSTMEHVALLADAEKASSFDWTLTDDLLVPAPGTLTLANQFDHIWFVRKQIWTYTRKRSESNELEALGAIAPYLRAPLRDWLPSRAIAKDDVPDFVFLIRRHANQPPLVPTLNGHPLLTRFAPRLTLPARWEFPPSSSKPFEFRVSIPPELRGHRFFIGFRSSSNETEPLRVTLEFENSGVRVQKLVLQPYAMVQTSGDFFYLTIPAAAESALIRVDVNGETEWLAVENVTILGESPPSSPEIPPQSSLR